MRTFDELINITQNVVHELEEVREINNQTNEIVTVMEEENKRNKRNSINFAYKKRMTSTLLGAITGAYVGGAPLGVAAYLGAISFPVVGIVLVGGALIGGIIGNLMFK
ncbi:hypothetical protein ACQ4LE_000606 [Meloidogyne hapla]